MEAKNLRFVPSGEVCEIEVTSSLVVEMFRSTKFTGNREGLNGFRPAVVLKNKLPVWTYDNSGAQKGVQFAELFQLGEEYYIAVRDNVKVASVLKVSDFASMVTAKLAGKLVTLGGSPVHELLEIKQLIAGSLDLEYDKTSEEEEILLQKSAAARDAMRERQAEAAAEKEAQRKARAEFISGILARTKVTAWSLSGQKYYGIPVYSDEEWLPLPDGTYCILMQDDVPTQAFILKKKNSKVEKIRTTEVSAEMPKREEVLIATLDIPEAVDQIKVTLRGESKTVLIFEGMGSLKKLQASGLNSGTWVGIVPQKNQPTTIYGIHKDKIETIGHVRSKKELVSTAQA